MAVFKKLKSITKKIIYLFKKYLLNASLVAATISDSENTIVNKIVSVLIEAVRTMEKIKQGRGTRMTGE